MSVQEEEWDEVDLVIRQFQGDDTGDQVFAEASRFRAIRLVPGRRNGDISSRRCAPTARRAIYRVGRGRRGIAAGRRRLQGDAAARCRLRGDFATESLLAEALAGSVEMMESDEECVRNYCHRQGRDVGT